MVTEPVVILENETARGNFEESSTLSLLSELKHFMESSKADMKSQETTITNMILENTRDLYTVLQNDDQWERAINDHKVEFMAMIYANREEFLDAQRILFHDQEKIMEKRLDDIS